MELAPNHHRQPDLLVLAATAVRRGQPPAARPADVFLAVEVMSPGSVTEDRITKPAVYARAGIPHYWRLESGDEGELALHVYRLAGDVYTEAACFRGDDGVEIDEPLRLRFPLTALLG